MISVTCPKCSEMMEVPDSLAGAREVCPVCGNTCSVPTPVIVAPATQPVVAAPPVGPAVVATSQVNVNIGGSSGKSTSGLGVAALVLGIIAALTCWIPFIGMIGMPLAILGAVLGFAGLLAAAIGRRRGVGMPVAGLVVCLVSIIIATAMTGAATVAVGGAAKSAAAVAAAAAAKSAVPPPSGAAAIRVVELRSVRLDRTVPGDPRLVGEVKNVRAVQLCV